jgi:hypothetical protein
MITNQIYTSIQVYKYTKVLSETQNDFNVQGTRRHADVDRGPKQLELLLL